ncbi:MAG: iron ABC transporter permease [Armatimonadetes bacterium]|nr:iron ABC transporter permease [Armatimonadota bacterium]
MRRGAIGPVSWLALALLLVAAVLAHLLASGVFSIPEVWKGLMSGPGNSPEQVVLWSIRLPRVCAAALVGAILSMVGAAFQSLFRNPLADPYIIGVSSGAAVGGAIASILGLSTLLGGTGAVALAFLTALGGLVLVIIASRGRGGLALSSLLIAGAAVGSFLWALVTFFLAYAGQDASRILYWLLGSFVSMDWQRVTMLAIVGTLGYLVLHRNARPLTLMAVGEESSARLGVETERIKWSTLLVCTAMAAGAVAAVGIVGFVGLFVPHIGRRLFGAQLEVLLPATAVLGAASVVLADLLAQRLIPGQEINIGVLTALIGAPFLMLLLRNR